MQRGSQTIAAAYAEALRRVVTPGMRVLDLGGDVGRRAVLACRLGARHVYSVHGGGALTMAQEMAVANGCANRVTFIPGLLDRNLDEPFDLVLAELPGGLPLHGVSLAGRGAARPRIWARQALTMPRREYLWAVPVEAAELYGRHVWPWEALAAEYDLAAARRLSVNTWSRCQTSGRWLAAPRRWASVDYADPPGEVFSEVEWGIDRASLAHGLAVWPEVELADDVVVGSRRDEGESSEECAFFPWPQPVALEAGDLVAVAMRGQALGVNDTWSWTSRIVRDGGERHRFVQSTFLGRLDVPGAFTHLHVDD